MKSQDSLLAEIDVLRNSLTEALQALEAIRSGGVDALVVYSDEGEQIYTLEGADQTYRVMVEAINEGAATISEDGIITWANACLAEMLKIPLESLLGSQVTSSIAAEHVDAFKDILLHSQQEKCKLELDLNAQDGTMIPVLLSLSPIPSMSQPMICLIATDLTEHKLNIQIAAAERAAKAIVDQAAEGIVVCDVEGKIVQLSQPAMRLAGEDPLYRQFDEVFPLTFERAKDSSPPFSIHAVLAGQTIHGVEAALLDPHTNRTVILHLSAKSLDIPSDGRLGCIITMTDLTERKHAERVIRRYASRLERSNKDLEDFAFIASHDLQEPLRKIQSFGRILVGKFASSLGKEGSDYVVRMQEAANRMEKMVSDLLTYSRVATQSRPYEEVDLNLVLKDVLSDLERRISQTGGIVEVEELPTIEADPIQMHQLFQNLLSNALKFHKPGQPPLINVTSRPVIEEGNASTHYLTPAVEILVKDHGIGFEMEYKDRIFQPFQRLHGRSEYEGSGIGLSICRRITERHHGSIRVTSSLGIGTTFLVILPEKQSPADMET